MATSSADGLHVRLACRCGGARATCYMHTCAHNFRLTGIICSFTTAFRPPHSCHTVPCSRAPPATHHVGSLLRVGGRGTGRGPAGAAVTRAFRQPRRRGPGLLRPCRAQLLGGTGHKVRRGRGREPASALAQRAGAGGPLAAAGRPPLRLRGADGGGFRQRQGRGAAQGPAALGVRCLPGASLGGRYHRLVGATGRRR